MSAKVIDLDSHRPSSSEAEHLQELIDAEYEKLRRSLEIINKPDPPKPPWRIDAEKEFERNGYDWYRTVPSSAINIRAEEIRREKYE